MRGDMRRPRSSMTAASRTNRSPAGEECILVLQGGGALGAYQAGVFEALGSESEAPQWVAGIMNEVLMAGAQTAPARLWCSRR